MNGVGEERDDVVKYLSVEVECRTVTVAAKSALAGCSNSADKQIGQLDACRTGKQ